MSDDEDTQTVGQSDLTRIISDLDIDLKLQSAAQRGDTELVKELLYNGAHVVPDEVSGQTHQLNYYSPISKLCILTDEFML